MTKEFSGAVAVIFDTIRDMGAGEVKIEGRKKTGEALSLLYATDDPIRAMVLGMVLGGIDEAEMQAEDAGDTDDPLVISLYGLRSAEAALRHHMQRLGVMKTAER